MGSLARRKTEGTNDLGTYSLPATNQRKGISRRFPLKMEVLGKTSKILVLEI
jgi:hypothetical protein